MRRLLSTRFTPRVAPTTTTAAASNAVTMMRPYASLAGNAYPPENRELLNIVAAIRDKLPADGTAVPAGDFAALLDSELPNRSYNVFGLYTVREVAEACPSMFHVVPDNETGWYAVGRSDTEGADGRLTSSSSNGASSSSPSSSSGIAAKSRSRDATKYIFVKGDSFVPLEEALTPEAADVPIDTVLRYLHTNTSYKVRTGVTVQPRAVPHGAHVFIDGDSLPRELVTSLYNTLKLTAVSSTRTVIRQAATSPHGTTDIICRAPSQTFQVLENQIELLGHGSAAILKPVVIMCSEAQKHLYAPIARKYAGRINMMLCTPSTVGHATV